MLDFDFFFLNGFCTWTFLLYFPKTQLFNVFQTFLPVTESIDDGNCWIKLSMNLRIFFHISNCMIIFKVCSV